MDKFIICMFLFFFISGTFLTGFSSVSASELVEDSWTIKTPMTQARYNLSVVSVVNARDAFAPLWLKEGVYVKHEHSSPAFIGVFDVSDPQFAGTNYLVDTTAAFLEVDSSIFMWQCVSVNATMAKLKVIFDYISDGVSLQRTGEAYVDLYTRAVYNADGVFLGTTHLWLPANPNNGQEITVWETDFETITAPVKFDDKSFTTTIQGKQDIFAVMESVTINGQPKLITVMCDLDTGLEVGGRVSWDPIYAVVGVSYADVGALSETNINLGPERSTYNWMQNLRYALLPIAIILIITALIIKRKKKRN